VFSLDKMGSQVVEECGRIKGITDILHGVDGWRECILKIRHESDNPRY